MKENILRGIASAIIAGLTAYFEALTIPIMVLIVVMVCDWLSGMAKAKATSKVSSRIGLWGIVKKVCYFLVVVVGMCADWIISAGLTQIGVTYQNNFYFGLIVTIWLIINELISILENLSVIGVPMPPFLTKLIGKLKVTVENKTEDKEAE